MTHFSMVSVVEKLFLLFGGPSRFSAWKDTHENRGQKTTTTTTTTTTTNHANSSTMRRRTNQLS